MNNGNGKEALAALLAGLVGGKGEAHNHENCDCQEPREGRILFYKGRQWVIITEQPHDVLLVVDRMAMGKDTFTVQAIPRFGLHNEKASNHFTSTGNGYDKEIDEALIARGELLERKAALLGDRDVAEAQVHLVKNDGTYPYPAPCMVPEYLEKKAKTLGYLTRECDKIRAEILEIETMKAASAP